MIIILPDEALESFSTPASSGKEGGGWDWVKEKWIFAIFLGFVFNFPFQPRINFPLEDSQWNRRLSE